MCISGVNVVCLMIGMKCKEIKGKIKYPDKAEDFYRNSLQDYWKQKSCLFLFAQHSSRICCNGK